jgi:hypothetical protein
VVTDTYTLPGSVPQITAVAEPIQAPGSANTAAPQEVKDPDPRVLVGYSSGQIWMLDGASATPLSLPQLVYGVDRLVSHADGSLEISAADGGVLDFPAADVATILKTGLSRFSSAQWRINYVFHGKVFLGSEKSIGFGWPTPSFPLPQGALCAGIAQHSLVLVVTSSSTLQVERADGPGLLTSPFLSNPQNVSFEGCHVEWQTVVAWRNSPQGPGVWRARVNAPGEGFKQIPLSGKSAITDAISSETGRSLFVRRGATIEVYGPKGLEGHVDTQGSLLSASADGLQLAVASADTVSLWDFEDSTERFLAVAG